MLPRSRCDSEQRHLPLGLRAGGIFLLQAGFLVGAVGPNEG